MASRDVTITFIHAVKLNNYSRRETKLNDITNLIMYPHSTFSYFMQGRDYSLTMCTFEAVLHSLQLIRNMQFLLTRRRPAF